MAMNESTNLPTGAVSVPVAGYNSNADNVTTQSAEMELFLSNSILPRTLLGGTRAMRSAGQEFLPKHPLESTAAYGSRLIRSTLLNAYAKTVSFLAGQVFQIEVTFTGNVPQEFIDYSESIDVKENGIDVFAKRAFSNGLGKGVSVILTDSVGAEPGAITTVQDEKEAGVRPYFKEVPIESVLGALVDEDGRLAQVRILESTMKRIGRFGSKQVRSVRVLEPGTWEVHEIDDNGSTEIVEEGTTISDSIPISIFIPGEETTIITGETPLMDLAELNGKHWRSSSDQDNILHVARVPTMFTKFVDLGAVPIGTANAINSDDENASMEYVEHSGQAIAAGREDLKETQSQMALFGLQALIPDSIPKTATEKQLSSSENNSSLATWAIGFTSVLQDAYENFGKFIGKEFPANGVILNTEFGIGVADPQELAQILASHEQGIISAQACFDEFRRRGVYDEHLMWDDMAADMEQEKRDAVDMATLAGAAFGTPSNEDDAE